MKIKVNGKDQVIDAASLTVTELLKTVKVESPEMVSVQLNGEFLSKEHFANKYVKDADEVDFLYFMAGGIEELPVSEWRK
ncbi:MAG: thiamine biosynthesis protein ThiS [Omnitrophica bacterium RIFCSPLOWO2_12_FULL_44_17]|uniref:Thiamine biosynthesis protein ThiS n=1 Tax=Candidatus Danuiimicrobium aquiferis TaxID=1801832 RepID=A0A1G1KQH8_9BACT|nr:MAG: thiamine biosynthesis protein ThiS [Omnitrophica bacterium RIFCSPHIGHO2_02_FULL_45_28]OGW95156.1 MAG: thiamine biosynthesis protein ThiS [Omnitrophica bacterium RIFCSPLOWO2_12_FULL_44_17]OGX01699.1 MAG: thiamine biosynthesis protein ThiS [Omnitrophica bacterium RIFCSPLOWO2_02_FULL_44_11]